MFESAILKLNRAEIHIADLKREFEAFVVRKPHRFGIKNDVQSGETVIQIRLVEAVPDSFALIIGDAIHNLRCALDHMTWEVIGWDGGKQNKRLQFLCRDDRMAFEAACDAIETPSVWVKNLFKNFEVFPGGKGGVFHVLANLDNADKHRVIAPVIGATTHPDFVIFNADGIIQSTWSGNRFSGFRESFPIANVPPGGYVELKDDTQCSPSIFMRDVPQVDAFEALKRFGEAVRNALQQSGNMISANRKNA